MDFTQKPNYILVLLAAVMIFSSGSYYIKNQQNQEIMLSVPEAPLWQQEEKILVHIAGQVISPGVYYFNINERVDDAIKKAVPMSDANLDALNLAETLKDGQRIFVPTIVVSSMESISLGAEQQIKSMDNKVSINNANQKELETLPGIGPVLAGNIINYREANGAFSSIDGIKQVPGIGDKRYEEIKEKISIN